MSQSTILTCAVTGNLTTPEQTAYLPITTEQIAELGRWPHVRVIDGHGEARVARHRGYVLQPPYTGGVVRRLGERFRRYTL